MIARRFFISGEVQGVGFRYFALRSAGRHQVHGFAKNLSGTRGGRGLVFHVTSLA
jgi:acylphosphatase